ncbi:AAL063Cp [Eremothecium gossypii ATCC 10895]|uniref:AAL063Cp n=1 Tax=Eremothecium gossypii (strain ATCC 10895 / CBS 109.51 / FGSC 9923 / NRRL Y-1056) TaxID=284811 RepID=Q75EZ1_EREGS|nr:AAL063Cp [Eremothecium gossypii ATCC 10895]AAS50303.1 AAL063Cp [Eremothecium gossypii ATCC 10895]AEY94589.1 FAAL063Cp [Eremothecium gossypii FDAG1]
MQTEEEALTASLAAFDKKLGTYRSINAGNYADDAVSGSYSVVVNSRYAMLCGSDFEEPLDGAQTLRAECISILRSSLPISMAFLMEFSMTICSLFIIGHLCTAMELASASLAVMTYNITGLSLVEGLATALDTVCPQAYGSQRYSKVGLYFLRGSAMIMVGMSLTAIIWFFSASWLQLLIPEADLIPKIQLYLRIMILGIPALVLFSTGKRYLQAQAVYEASTYVLAIVFPLTIVFVLGFTRHFGFVGAPIGIVTSQWLMVIILFVFARSIRPDTLRCWYPFMQSSHHFKRVFTHWRPLWDLAFPGLVMLEAEFLSIEALTLISTYFGVNAIASQTVIANLSSLIYQIPFAIGCVISNRVAHYVGSGLIKNAQMTIKASYCLASIVGVSMCLFVAFLNKPLARLFTNNEEVVELAHSVSYILAVNQIYDAFNTFGAAILRGQGRQRLGGIWNMIAYYIVSLPLGWWLAFGPLKLKLAGLWYGCGIGILILALAFSWYIYNSDWQLIIQECNKRENTEVENDMLHSDSVDASFSSQ